MAVLNLDFVGFGKNEGFITVDGKFAKLKKTAGAYTCTYETDKSDCEVVIYKTHHYYGKYWFWRNLIYFIISVFGIFDVKKDKKCLVLDGKYIVSAEQDARLGFKRQDFVDGGPLAVIYTPVKVQVISNVQYSDKTAMKRHSKMKLLKLLSILSALLVLTVVIILAL